MESARWHTNIYINEFDYLKFTTCFISTTKFALRFIQRVSPRSVKIRCLPTFSCGISFIFLYNVLTGILVNCAAS